MNFNWKKIIQSNVEAEIYSLIIINKEQQEQNIKNLKSNIKEI